MPLYQIQFRDGSTTEVRAFSKAAALAMYPNATGLVGQQRAIPSNPCAEVLTPSTGTPVFIAPARGRFKINPQALRDAVAELGLSVPVRVRLHSRAGNTNGNYCRRGPFHAKGDHHDIMVKTYLSPEEASSTLWHELTHAMQAERTGSPAAWHAFSKAQRSYSYDRRPIEIEARAMSAAKINSPLTF